MGHTQILEGEFERNICDAMAERGWIYSGDANDAGWDAELALFPEDVLWWLSMQYPDEYETAVPSELAGAARTAAERAVLNRLHAVLGGKGRVDPRSGKEKGGLLGALRTGFEVAQTRRPTARFGAMAAFHPANPALETATEIYKQNRLRVLRQVHFDPRTNHTIDLVCLVNGVPVITMELKTDNTQSVAEGMEQYRTSRVPTKATPLLTPGRCLVHFVVSNHEVMMTTKLAGADTRFLPFNQGDKGHSGNPPSETGSDTDYLWREILEPAQLLRVLQSFAMREANGTLVFPRYHQLRAVEKVTSHVRTNGVGGRYLIWHSAGSGKTKTIAWLAHRLQRLFHSAGGKVFDSVLVISDRTVLDDQIRRAVGLLGAAQDVIVSVDSKGGAKSKKLRAALHEGGHIITCTLQTFPEVLKLVDGDADFADRSWCIIADEAHSSQTGETATKLRQLLSARIESDPDPDDEEVTSDDLLIMQDSAIAQSINMTFIALTATPKHRTLRLFGTHDEVLGTWRAFDTYTMAQAIEEDFIHDVLKRYSTYKMFARLRDTLGNETQVEETAAVKSLVRFIRLHPTSIAQKVEIVVEHFRDNVMGSLSGQAKAMVVSDSRMAAVHWSLEMNKYIAKKGYKDMTTLVAFSDKITAGNEEYTEAALNGHGDVAGHFAEHDECKVLIVANKFQTGFDEPKLCAMYVDKKLSGIAAIQTLSRLNRTSPNKPDPIVLDFTNEPEDIREAFVDYYSDAYIDQETDPNALFELADRIDLAGIYTGEELQGISQAYLDDVPGELIAKLISTPVHRWNAALLHAGDNKAEREKVLGFRSDLRSYYRAWDFMSQIIDFQDADLHRRAIVAHLLERNLHVKSVLVPVDLTGIELTGVGVAATRLDADVSLTAGADGSDQPLPAPRLLGEVARGDEPTRIALSEAVSEVNALFSAAGLEMSDKAEATWLYAVWGKIAEDAEVQAMAAENSAEQLTSSPKFRDKVNKAVVAVAEESQSLTETTMSDGTVYDGVTRSIARVASVQFRQSVADLVRP